MYRNVILRMKAEKNLRCYWAGFVVTALATLVTVLLGWMSRQTRWMTSGLHLALILVPHRQAVTWVEGVKGGQEDGPFSCV